MKPEYHCLKEKVFFNEDSEQSLWQYFDIDKSFAFLHLQTRIRPEEDAPIVKYGRLN